jgi:carboxymethylenebutenolidase
LEEAGLRHSNEVYAGARHGYTMADTAPYDAAATERHFDALRDLLARTL